MIRFRSYVLVSSLAVSLGGSLLAGCSKGSGTGPVASASASASAGPADDVEAFVADEHAKLTLEIYEKLVLGLADCKLVQNAIDMRCPANDRLRRVRGRASVARDLANLNAALGQKLIGHESATVRFQAATMLQSFFGSNPASQKLVLDALRKEKEPAVIAALLRVVGSRMKENPEVKQLLVDLSDHASEDVRKEALGWFLSQFGEGVEGGFEKVAEKVEKDPSEAVRAYLCDRLYGGSDERAIGVLKKLLAQKDLPKKVWQGCFNGVIKTWTGFPQPRKPSKDGFELTMKLLEAKPRDAENPPWAALTTLRAAKGEFPPNDKFGQEWLEKVKPWIKRDRLLKALQDIVTDGKASWMARTGALNVLDELGADKKVFEGLEKKYKDAKQGDDFHVYRRVADILAKRGAPGAPAPSGVAPPPGLPFGHPPIPGSPPPGGPGAPAPGAPPAP